ncbi:MAG: UbiD family decarboxylase [Vulcanimicrobiota bacterium]
MFISGAMKEYRNLLQRMKSIHDPLKRTLFFLALLTEELGREKGIPVVVGGFALEFYSTGGYATGDIDLIYPDPDLCGTKLRDWGFVKEGRHWISEELDLFIETPGSFLPEIEQKRVTTVEIEGMTVCIIGVEDLIIDRLNAFVHWKSTDDGYWARELIYIYFDTLDLDYLKDRCGGEQTLPALENILKEVENTGDENHQV